MALGRNIRQRIKANRSFGVGRVEVANRVGAGGRDAIRDRLSEIAVRVDDGDALPRIDVVHGEVKQGGALARARLADQVPSCAM